MQIYLGSRRQGAAREASLVSLAFVLASCSSHRAEPMAADWDGLGLESAVVRDAGSADSGPEQCDEEGARIECGTVSEHHANYITCSQGYRTCTNGVWGPCEGVRDFQ